MVDINARDAIKILTVLIRQNSDDPLEYPLQHAVEYLGSLISGKQPTSGRRRMRLYEDLLYRLRQDGHH